MKLDTYEDWKNCITVICGIPLTAEYIDMRLVDLNDPKSFHTQRFIETWGKPHLQRVISWFKQAKSEVTAAPLS